MSDGVQDMLFGTGTAVVADEVANRQLRLCALNVQGPSPARADKLVDWLTATACNVLVLTEVQTSDAGRQMIASLRASGYTITCPQDWQNGRHFTAIVTKGFGVQPLAPSNPRINAVDLHSQGGTIRLVGIYGPTNGLTVDSSASREQFQTRCLTYLRDIRTARLCIAGDLNVVEPGHQPPQPDFAPHDYAFYTGLLDLGLTDAYRRVHPGGTDHSWASARFGTQRLDHVLLSDAAGALTRCAYDHEPRTRGLSDHSALVATIGPPAAGTVTQASSG